MQQNDNSHVNKKAELFFIGFTIIFIIGLLIYKRHKTEVLDEYGVYVIGKVVDVSSVDNGYISTINYWFDKKVYTFNYTTFPAVKGPYVYLLISKKNPSVCSLIEKTKVDTCLIKRGYSDSFWSKIPRCF